MTAVTYFGEQILSLQRREHGSSFLISMTSTTGTGLYQFEQDEIFFLLEFHVMTITAASEHR